MAKRKRKSETVKALLMMAEAVNAATDAQLLAFQETIIAEMDDRKLIVTSQRKRPSWMARLFRDMMHKTW